MKLLCKGIYAPISKGKVGSAPVMHPRFGVPAEINRYQIPKRQKGALWATVDFKVTIIIRSPYHQFIYLLLLTNFTSILKFT